MGFHILKATLESRLEGGAIMGIYFGSQHLEPIMKTIKCKI